MLSSFVRKCRSVLFTLTALTLFYFGIPSTSYASASDGMPSAARTLMIAVFVGGGIILALFIVLVYLSGRRNRRS